MISIPSLFGFPPPEKRDSVRFYVAKKMPYNLRIHLAVGFLIVGFGLQLIFFYELLPSAYFFCKLGNLWYQNGYTQFASLSTLVMTHGCFLSKLCFFALILGPRSFLATSERRELSKLLLQRSMVVIMAHLVNLKFNFDRLDSMRGDFMLICSHFPSNHHQCNPW